LVGINTDFKFIARYLPTVTLIKDISENTYYSSVGKEFSFHLQSSVFKIYILLNEGWQVWAGYVQRCEDISGLCENNLQTLSNQQMRDFIC